MKVVLLNSGGMDTFLLAHRLAAAGVEALHLFVDVGQVYAQKEVVAAEQIAASVGAVFEVVHGAPLARYEHHSGIIPFRNAELILCAAQFADDICMGVVADEVNSDKSPEFMRAMETVLNISHRQQYWTQGRTFTVQAPVRHMSKAQLVAEYLRGGGYLAPLMATVSCYDGGTAHCGNCPSCLKRWVALVVNGVDVAGHFVRDPAHWKTAEQYADMMDGYTVTRAAEILAALRAAGLGVAVLAALRARSRPPGATAPAPAPGAAPVEAAGGPYCTYPACNCPFDSPGPPGWCARGLPHAGG